ncbi:hypothetical protein B7G68_05375 [Caulobacter segnis]|uniref:Antifreeze protein n=2 Tax=Caulobacter segnis TaxID=88688 RepID=D5VIH7_CAUST|nr:hypothetical protein [Caulobacter segnis]ADG09551.1 conserved hypothetical protein [Caulobacter segnis ATCC 21756]AVQ01334.1 hypothetical protein B7G68_05375 [Caulobacter segnis]
MTRRKDPWTSLAFDSWALGMEASAVIGLRMMKLAAGGAAAQAEAQLMVSEKVATSVTLPMLAATGQLGATGPAIASGSLAHLRRKVRANRRRLSKA